VISNSYGASKGAGLFLTSTPRSETTDILTADLIEGRRGEKGVELMSGLQRDLISVRVVTARRGEKQQHGVFIWKR
jgi:hypothetical protein